MNEEKFLIKITGDNFHFEQQINELQKAKIVSFLVLPSNILPVEEVVDQNLPVSKITSNVTPNNSTISLREYLLKIDPVTNAQKIVVFTMYLEDVELLQTVSKEQIKDLFVQAKEPLPQNFTRDFDSAIKLTWISSSKEENEYYLTTIGREAIMSKFKDVGTRTNIRKNGKGHKKSSLPIREQIENFDFSNIDTYWKLHSKGDKILWLVVQASVQGINDLNLREISRLAEKIHDNLPMKNIYALIAVHEKKSRASLGLVNNNRILRPLKPGLDYIQEKINSAESHS